MKNSLLLFVFLLLFNNCKKDEPMVLRCWKYSYEVCLYEAATDTKISCFGVMSGKWTAYTKEEILQHFPEREYSEDGTRYSQYDILEFKDYNLDEC